MAQPGNPSTAARNRAKVLAAAERLFAERRPVTMEEIAKAVGAGRGTLYRRYPDVASIAVALLDEHERGLAGAATSERRRLWPRTTNPYLLVSQITAADPTHRPHRHQRRRQASGLQASSSAAIVPGVRLWR